MFYAYISSDKKERLRKLTSLPHPEVSNSFMLCPDDWNEISIRSSSYYFYFLQKIKNSGWCFSPFYSRYSRISNNSVVCSWLNFPEDDLVKISLFKVITIHIMLKHKTMLPRGKKERKKWRYSSEECLLKYRVENLLVSKTTTLISPKGLPIYFILHWALLLCLGYDSWTCLLQFFFSSEKNELHRSYSGVILTQSLLILGGIDIVIIGWGISCELPTYRRGSAFNWVTKGLLGSGMISCKVTIGHSEYSNRIRSWKQGAIASCSGGVDNTGCEQEDHRHELKIHESNCQPKNCKMKC